MTQAPTHPPHFDIPAKQDWRVSGEIDHWQEIDAATVVDSDWIASIGSRTPELVHTPLVTIYQTKANLLAHTSTANTLFSRTYEANLFESLRGIYANLRRPVTDDVEASALARLAELRVLEDGEVFNEPSATDLLTFIRTKLPKPPSIFLLDNGDLRASWDGAEGLYFGIQFMGNNEVQFTAVGPKLNTGRIARSSGLIQLDMITEQALASRMTGLIFG